jgi:hypothetical protein
VRVAFKELKKEGVYSISKPKRTQPLSSRNFYAVLVKNSRIIIYQSIRFNLIDGILQAATDPFISSAPQTNSLTIPGQKS